jgi:hypothetical protein
MSARRATYRVNVDGWWVLADLLTERREFNPDSASLRGRAGRFGPFHSGRLRGRSEQAFLTDMHAIDYVVFSYATPIAWHTPGGWTVPVDRYSVTTSKHQGRVRPAVDQAAQRDCVEIWLPSAA